ncbi:MAG: LuxR C-terminal-related transcriptional regulator, partial [Bacillota bacterium]|nr:LuxR C-terminal-related transcriptional regulator [Bacillota bacterium]
TVLVVEEDDFQEIKKIDYVFTHDIIYELVYKNINLKKKSEMHYRIAKLYLELENLNVKIDKFLLVSQLLRSDYDLIIKENSSRWISILFENGIEEKQIPNIERALEIFKFCESILPYSSTEIEDEFKVKLNIEIGECDFLCEKYDEAEKRFELLILNCDSFDSLINIKINYMNLYLYKGHFNKVLSFGKEILERLQFSVESQSIIFNLIKMRFLYSDRNIEKRKKLSEIDDNRILMVLEVLSIMIPAASSVDNKLFLKILITIANLTAKYGDSKYSLVGYAACSLIYYNVLHDYNKGERIEKKLEKLLEINREESTKSLVYLAIGTFLIHRTSPIEDSIVFLEKGIIEGARTSKFSYSGYSIISLTYIKYIIGIPLNEVRNYIIDQIEISKKIGESTEAFIEYVFNKHIKYLVNGIISYKPKQKDEVINVEVIENLMEQVFTIQRYYLEGKIREAYEITNHIDKNIFYLTGHIIYLDAIFYCLIIRIGIYNQLEEKTYNKKQIDKLMKIFKYQIGKYEYNYYAHYLLIKAEYADVFEEKKFSEKYFNESILMARERGYLHIEGIGNLFAARYYKYNEKLSNYYVREALNLFKKWGALYICSLIEEEFNIQKKSNEIINEKIELLTYESEENILDNLDEIDLMSEEDGFSYILNYFSKKYNISYCAILVEKTDEMHLRFEKKGDNDVISHKELIRMKHVSYLSRKVIRYVARTGEEINLNRNQNNDLFSKDLYILGKNELSILCIPIEYFGVFVGMVYFEKNTNDGFSKEISQSIRTIIPILMSKSEMVKNINGKNINNSSEFEELLTDREKDVLKLVAKGMSNSAISKELFIALGTVKNHLSNIYSKLEVDSRLKAVIKANKMNIIDV